MRGLAVVVDDDGNYIIKKELVLCKDCKHRPYKNPYEDEYNLVAAPDWKCPCVVQDDEYYSYIPADDFYCASGEKK